MDNMAWLEIWGKKKKLDSAFLFRFVIRKYMSNNILDIFLQTRKWMDSHAYS